MSEKILSHINETIREQEGRERLKTISRDLWIGEGSVESFDNILIHLLTATSDDWT